MMSPTGMQEMAKTVSANPDLEAKMKEDPAGTLNALSAAMPLQTDVWIYRSVVAMLGVTIIMTVGGAVLLSFYEKTIPEGVFVMAGTCAGAMAGLITQQRTK